MPPRWLLPPSSGRTQPTQHSPKGANHDGHHFMLSLLLTPHDHTFEAVEEATFHINSRRTNICGASSCFMIGRRFSQHG